MTDKVTNLSLKENIILMGVLVSAFAIRIYYFVMTLHQPLWWDELCYGSLAKNIVYHSWDGLAFIVHESALRPLLFSYAWAALIKIGAGEIFSKIILVLLPSILNVFLVYLIAKEIFNKRIGIISAIIYAVLWMNLFYSLRFLVHMFEMSFFLGSLYFFIIYLKENNFKHFFIAMILISITTLIRYQAGILLGVYLIVLIFSKKLFLNKFKFWLAGITGLIPLIIFFCINLYKSGELFPALSMNPMGTSSFEFGVLSMIPFFLQNIFLIAFCVGLPLLLLNMFIDRRKLEEQLTLIFALVFFLSFLIFYIRAAEDRWLFEILAVLVIVAGYGIDCCAIQLEKFIGEGKGKVMGALFIIFILAVGVYGQVSHADELIKNKKDTYVSMREVFNFIRLNSPSNSVVAGYGIEPYVIYYGERKYIGLTTNETDVELIPQADLLVVHAFNPHPQYLMDYYLNNEDKLMPVYAGYENAQPAAIVYVERVE